jgi:hypothetical protein
MSETKQDARDQLRYMKENKQKYLSKNNPARITLEEYNKRVKALRDFIYHGRAL